MARALVVVPAFACALAACSQEPPSNGPPPTVMETATASTVTLETVTVPPTASASVTHAETSSALTAGSAASAGASASTSAGDDKRCAELHAKPYPEIGTGPAAGDGPVTLQRLGADPSPVGKALPTMAAGFRRCINAGLACDPDMQGSVRVSAKLDAKGNVVKASPERAKGLSRGVIDCIVEVVKKKAFDPPASGSETVVIPVIFHHAG